jgi:hypothetical protein
MFAATGTKDQDFHGRVPSSGVARPEEPWSATRAGEVKRRVAESEELALAYTEAGCAKPVSAPGCEKRMVDTRIKPYDEQQAEKAARAEQTRIFRRNQVFGLLILAAAICLWWLLHTNPKWIFPPGWWRW